MIAGRQPRFGGPPTALRAGPSTVLRAGFSPKAIAFLRALKRHNDREWFRERRDQYDTLLRLPMIDVIERLADDLRSFAPELVASPKSSLYRVYRDTRFSGDKSPLKTNVAAVFPCRGHQRHAAAGLYFEVAHGWVWVGGGMWAPDPSILHRVREHIAANPRRFRAIVESPAFRKSVGPLEGQKLQRVPRGFPKDHAAAEYLKHRQFLAGREYPASFATSARFYPGLVATFKQIAPLVHFLNEPLLGEAGRAGKAGGAG